MSRHDEEAPPDYFERTSKTFYDPLLGVRIRVGDDADKRKHGFGPVA